MRLDVDLARRGRREGTFRLPRAADHGLEFYLRTAPATRGLEESREKGRGLKAVARMYDEAGELVEEIELTAQDLSNESRTYPPIPPPGHVWFHMSGPPPDRDYRIVIDVLEPAQRWTGDHQELIARGLPCGMILMARTVGYVLAGLSLLAGLLLAFVVHRVWHPKQTEAAAPPPSAGRAAEEIDRTENG